MNVKKENPIAVQSKRWLLAALLDLMEKDDFHSITITQLTQSGPQNLLSQFPYKGGCSEPEASGIVSVLPEKSADAVSGFRLYGIKSIF